MSSSTSEDIATQQEPQEQTNKSSRFNGCARSAALWGIGTGTAMGLHRWRMGSRYQRVTNFAFGTMFLITAPAYYLCVTERIWKEKNIEQMMKVSRIKPAEEMPEEVSIEEHPFLQKEEDAVLSMERELKLYEKKAGTVKVAQKVEK